MMRGYLIIANNYYSIGSGSAALGRCATASVPAQGVRHVEARRVMAALLHVVSSRLEH